MYSFHLFTNVLINAKITENAFNISDETVTDKSVAGVTAASELRFAGWRDLRPGSPFKCQTLFGRQITGARAVSDPSGGAGGATGRIVWICRRRAARGHP